ASTTPAAPRSTSGWGSRRSRPCDGPLPRSTTSGSTASSTPSLPSDRATSSCSASRSARIWRVGWSPRLPRPGNAASAPADAVSHGGACEPGVLERADAARADVVVSATGDDEDNLVISLLAKQEFAVARVIARVNHPKNQWLFTESWGVDVAMSPPHILGALIEEAVSVGDLVKLFRLEHGRV